MADERERRLLRRATEGDERALRTLYETFAPMLAVRLRWRGAHADLVEEILQDTFLTVWRRGHLYRGEGPVGAWLWGIAVRRFSMSLRSSRSAPASIGEIEPPQGDEEIRLEWIAVEDAVYRLEPVLRATLEAVAMRGMSIREIATEMGVPEGTVKSRLHRARRILRKETV